MIFKVLQNYIKKVNDSSKKILNHKAVEINPLSFKASANYGWFLSSKYCKDLDQAEKYYLSSILINPHYKHALYNYAMFLQDDRKDFKNAKIVIYI